MITMHEFDTIEKIYTSLLNIGGRLPERVYIRLSKLNGNPDFVKFAIESMVKGTPLEKIKLEFIEVKPKARCPTCGYEGEIEVPAHHARFVRCPFCNDTVDIIDGNEIEILVRE